MSETVIFAFLTAALCSKWEGSLIWVCLGFFIYFPDIWNKTEEKVKMIATPKKRSEDRSEKTSLLPLQLLIKDIKYVFL